MNKFLMIATVVMIIVSMLASFILWLANPASLAAIGLAAYAMHGLWVMSKVEDAILKDAIKR